MRVLYWSELFYPHVGGIEVFGGRLVPALRARGHEIVVITSSADGADADETLWEGVRICRFPFRAALTGRDYRRVLALRRHIAGITRALGPDLSHVNDLDCSLFFHLHTAGACRAPLLMTVHGYVPIPRQLPLIRRALSAAAWVSTVSHAVLDDVRASEPSVAGRSSVIRNSLPDPALEPTPLPRDPPRLLCLGRLHPDKGFDLAVEAFALVRRRIPRARLVVAGDGAERPRLERLAAASGAGAHVDFLGSVHPDAVAALLNTATLLLVPSAYEGFGLVALQAAQMGRPVIASRLGGLAEIVADQQTGLLVDRDPAAFAAAIEAILLAPEDAASRMGHAARQRAAAVFGWEDTVARYEALYAQVAGRVVRING